MDCPKCKTAMIRGRLLGDRYKIKWMDEQDKLLLGIRAFHSIDLGSGILRGRPKVSGFRCERCQLIVIDEKNC